MVFSMLYGLLVWIFAHTNIGVATLMFMLFTGAIVAMLNNVVAEYEKLEVGYVTDESYEAALSGIPKMSWFHAKSVSTHGKKK